MTYTSEYPLCSIVCPLYLKKMILGDTNTTRSNWTLDTGRAIKYGQELETGLLPRQDY